MIAEERRAILLRDLHEKGYLEVKDIAAHLGISSATIRRDLEAMELEGQCLRTRGGAIKGGSSKTYEPAYDVKSQRQKEKKRAIALAAAELVKDGDTIILDAGSTTYQLAQALYSKKRITVVTNDLKISTKLASNPNITLICTGGMARANVYTLLGSQVETFLKSLRVNLTFLGADAIHNDGTVANVNLEEVAVKQAMIHSGDKVILLTDSTKFEGTAFIKVCDLSSIDMIITDHHISPLAKELLNNWHITTKIVMNSEE